MLRVLPTDLTRIEAAVKDLDPWYFHIFVGATGQTLDIDYIAPFSFATSAVTAMSSMH